jgi:pimeloyl-ACP methyl ester carboxylesterase
MRAVWETCKVGAHIMLLVALVGCGAANHHGASAGGGGDFAGPIDIGNGRHLFLECHGRGAPTVILESGYHNSSDPWSQSAAVAPAAGPAVLPALADEHRVCAYDRPGTLRFPDPPSISDRSSPVPMPRTAQDVVGDLHALLAAAHVPGPYILVGHSLGGLFIRLYAQTHPEQVRGLVFVDAFAVEIPRLMGSDWPLYRQLLDGPPPQFADAPSFELIDIDKSIAQVAEAPAVPPVPAVVLTRTEPFAVPGTVSDEQSAKLEQAWRDATSDLIALWPQTPHLIATGSDHFVQVHQPDLVVAGVRLVMQRSAQNR